jgi:hypothetical protein
MAREAFGIEPSDSMGLLLEKGPGLSSNPPASRYALSRHGAGTPAATLPRGSRDASRA